MDMQINLKRLQKDIEELGQIGIDPAGGISRPSFSKADLQARQWLKHRIKEAGLELRQDGAGNIFARLPGEGKIVMAGSHLDTVLNGGMFDGSIGVLAALECLRRIKEEGYAHLKPLEAACFTDEEGNLVGDFLGSRAFTGQLNRALLEEETTSFGRPLKEILKSTEFSIDSILNASSERPGIKTFLELHIEQGIILESEEKTIGIVDRIAGKHDWLCCFIGRADHAGTSPFELRQDAFLGLADFSLKSTQYVATKHYGSLLTINRVHTTPGAFSIVPGRVDFTLDFRSPQQSSLDNMEEQLLLMAEDIASTRGLQFSYKEIDRTSPTPVPTPLTSLLEEECRKLGLSSLTLHSGAGHDAQMMATVTDAGMIFIPCTDGISHAPEEKILWEDLEKGSALLLSAMLRLANENH